MKRIKVGDVVQADDGRVGVVSKLTFASMVEVEYALDSSFCWELGAELLERYTGKLTPTLVELRRRVLAAEA